MAVTITGGTHASAGAIVFTVGTNAYLSLADADTYFASRVDHATWDAATAADKASALIEATSHIDAESWRGARAVSTQALAFPRAIPSRAAFATPGVTARGSYSVQSSTPQAVKDATCEEAVAILGGVSPRQQMQHDGVSSVTIGSTSESYSGRGRSGLLSAKAARLLKRYRAGSVPM
jgi:hypothetical protein